MKSKKTMLWTKSHCLQVKSKKNLLIQEVLQKAQLIIVPRFLDLYICHLDFVGTLLRQDCRYGYIHELRLFYYLVFSKPIAIELLVVRVQN